MGREGTAASTMPAGEAAREEVEDKGGGEGRDADDGGVEWARETELAESGGGGGEGTRVTE